MTRRSRFVRIAALLLVPVLAAIAFGDKITLKDGTILEGRTIKQGDGYWIKLADGSSRTIPSADIDRVERTGAGSSGTTPDKSTPDTSTPETHTPTHPGPSATDKPGKGGSLARTKRKADACDLPLAAVTIWQEFIEAKPAPEDLKVAQEEMARWKKMNDEGAERIKGKWVQGKDLKDLRLKVEKLNTEFIELMRTNQTLQAVKKLDESQGLYPNSYWTTFWLGFMDMLENQDDKAEKYFEQALKLHPKLAPALGNQGLILIKKKKLSEGVLKLAEAADAADTAEIAVDLSIALSQLPPSQRNSERYKAATAASSILNAKYSSLLQGKQFKEYLPITLNEPPGGGGSGHPKIAGGMWSGTGFLISADGLILTNRHVVENAKTLMVILDGGVQKAGEVVQIDDQQDLALIRVKTDGKSLPFVMFSPKDAPGAGADCTVMGFPLLDRLGANIKITRGIVTGIQEGDLGPNVLVDAKVNPGNSGGPMLDKHGNVMAIVSMKTLSTTSEDTYGIGLSAGHIRKFLEKNKIAVTPGPETGDSMSAEDIATKIRPAAVCILSTR